MILSVLFSPAPFFDEAFDEEIFAGGEVDHAAVVVRDKGDVGDAANGDGIGDLEFAVPKVGAARAKNERKIVRDVQEFAAVYAHADENLGQGINLEWAAKVLVFEKTPDWGAAVFRRNVRGAIDRNETVHGNDECLSLKKQGPKLIEP